jgi:hypothetical protein
VEAVAKINHQHTLTSHRFVKRGGSFVVKPSLKCRLNHFLPQLLAGPSKPAEQPAKPPLVDCHNKTFGR